MRFRDLRLTAFRPERLAPSARAIGAYLACLVAAITGSLWCWPALPADWIHIETEREGLGIIIATLVLALAGLSLVTRTSRSATCCGPAA